MVCNICPILIIVKWLVGSFVEMHQCLIPYRPIQCVTNYMPIDKLKAIFNKRGQTSFPKSGTPQNFSGQKGDKKQDSYWGTANVRYYLKKNVSRATCTKSPGICAPLFIVLRKNVNSPKKGEIIALQP